MENPHVLHLKADQLLPPGVCPLFILILKCYTPCSLICMGNCSILEDAVEYCSVWGVWYRGDSCEGEFASLQYQELDLLLHPRNSALQQALLGAGVGAHSCCHSSWESWAAGQHSSCCYVTFKVGWACWQRDLSKSHFSAVMAKTHWPFIYKQVCKTLNFNWMLMLKLRSNCKSHLGFVINIIK